MTLKNHIIAGAIGAAVIYPLLGGLKTGVFFVSSFLIDADHYLDYLYRIWKTTGKLPNLSPKSMFKYYDQFIDRQKIDNRVLGFSLLHTVEAFVVIYLLALYVNYSFFIMIIAGMAYHIIFDEIWFIKEKLLFIRSISITEHLIRTHMKKAKGINPDDFNKEMYELSLRDGN